MTYLLPLIALLAGAGLAGIAVWFLLKAKIAAAAAETRAELQPQLAALTERVGAKEQQLAALHAALAAEVDQKTQAAFQLQQESNARASVEEKASRIPQLEAQLKACEEKMASEVAQLQADLLAQKRQNGELAERAKYLEERLATERQQLETIQQKFQKDFEAVAHKLLVENSSRFGQQSAENLDKLLRPFQQNLHDFKAQLDMVHRDTVTHSALLKDQIGRIGAEAANLSRALKGDAKVLGNWGENMLDQILEKSGLQLGVHYRRQQGAKDEAGDQRFLDVIVELPEDKHLIIDSKVSLKCYEEYVNCTDEALRSKHLEGHILCLRSHVRGLGAKRYQQIHGINTPDFVLMYVPIEAAFFVAVGQDPALFSESLEKNVVLITNSTLLATLRTVASVWRLADQQKHALEIADRGGKLYDKFAGFVQDLQDIGRALTDSQKAWDEANRKLYQGPGNLVGQAEKLKALGVKASKKLPSHLAIQAETSEAASLLPNAERQEQPANRSQQAGPHQAPTPTS